MRGQSVSRSVSARGGVCEVFEVCECCWYGRRMTKLQDTVSRPGREKVESGLRWVRAEGAVGEKNRE